MLIAAIICPLLVAALLYGWVTTPVLIVICLCIAVVLFVMRKKRHSHSGFPPIDLLAQDSKLSQWNTGLKVSTCVGLLLFCIAANSFAVSFLVIFTVSMLILCVTRIGAIDYISLLLLPLTFIVLSGLALLIDFSPQPLGLIDIPFFGNYLSITAATQETTAHVMSRALAALCCLYALSLSTPMYDITSFLRRIHIAAVIVELMVLIYRYIFVLLTCLRSMSTAAQSRLGYRSHRTTWRSSSGIAANILGLSFARAGRSFDAMEARAYEGEVRFIEHPKPLTVQQATFAVGFVLLPVMILLLEGRVL